MMDFGFGSFLDKFESRFGHKATTALLVLIALSVASFCVNVTATYVVLPTVEFVNAIFSDDPALKASLGQTVSTITNLILWVIIAANVVNTLSSRRTWNANAQAKLEYEEFLRAAKEFWTDTGEYIEALEAIEADLIGARSATKRKELVMQLRRRVTERQEAYNLKIQTLNRNIGDLRGE